MLNLVQFVATVEGKASQGLIKIDAILVAALARLQKKPHKHVSHVMDEAQ